jgi:exonuclease SbcD
MMRFIHAADLHIDSPLRGLSRYEGAPVERLRNATRQALVALIELAIAEAVDLVLLAGDLYDVDWQDFRTGLFFREQMVQLNKKGIKVFIVQGNHDAQGVISRQLALPDNVKVFSSRKAETVQLDELQVAIHGHSFPERAVPEDLVPHYPAAIPGYLNIGMLHTSLNGLPGHDPYAPTTVATLASKGYDYWALGHIHARQIVHDSPLIVFPGNLQGRHAKETGSKGCELVSVEDGRLETQHVSLDAVRWHQVSVALDGLEKLSEVTDHSRVAITSAVSSAPDRLHAIRVTLSGITPLHSEESARPGTLAAAVLAAAQDITQGEVWIEKVLCDISSPIDRSAAATGDNAIAELIRLSDKLGADPDALKSWAQTELGEVLDNLPAELSGDSNGEDIPSLNDVEALKNLLQEAEATVLARLAQAGAA